MPTIDITKDPHLRWERYYPRFGGWNECDEEDRWWVEIRREPTVEHARRISKLVEASEDIEGGSMVAIVSLLCRGPYNLRLTDPEEGSTLEPDTIVQLYESTGSTTLIRELWDQCERRVRITEEEAGNSGGPSGGDTESPETGEIETPTPDGPEVPASDAKPTPGAVGARASTTQEAENQSGSAGPTAPVNTAA